MSFSFYFAIFGLNGLGKSSFSDKFCILKNVPLVFLLFLRLLAFFLILLVSMDYWPVQQNKRIKLFTMVDFQKELKVIKL